VFVFVSLTFINANGVNIVKNSGCVEEAFAVSIPPTSSIH